MSNEDTEEWDWFKIVSQGRQNRHLSSGSRRRVIRSNKLDPDTYIRKCRMLIEWVLKTFWPKCSICQEEITIEGIVQRHPYLPVVDLEAKTVAHALCADEEAEPLKGARQAVRVAAYKKLATNLVIMHESKCWYCLEEIRAEDFDGACRLTLHHVDSDRAGVDISGAPLRGVKNLSTEFGSNMNAELELLHTPCHKRHHKAPTTFKASRDRVNGRRSKRTRNWMYAR